MSREKTWTFAIDSYTYTWGSYLGRCQSFLYYLKNYMVSHAGWEVVGSSDTPSYEYEGVTGGGSYGGGSTGPYDMWSSPSVIRRAVDGSSPGWCILKGPTFQGDTPYILLALEGTTDVDRNKMLKFCSEKWELNSTDPVAYLPGAPSGSSSGGFSRAAFHGYYSGYNNRWSFGGCVEDGSFWMTDNMVGKVVITGFAMFSRVAAPVPPGVYPYVAGGDDDPNGFDYIYDAYFQIAPSDLYPDVMGPASWGDPQYGTYNGTYDSSTLIMDVTLDPLNFEGVVEPFPVYIFGLYESGNIEMKPTFVGRIADFYVAPRSLAEGDTIEDAGSIKYWKMGGYLFFPGDAVPTTG